MRHDVLPKGLIVNDFLVNLVFEKVVVIARSPVVISMYWVQFVLKPRYFVSVCNRVYPGFPGLFVWKGTGKNVASHNMKVLDVLVKGMLRGMYRFESEYMKAAMSSCITCERVMGKTVTSECNCFT
jgi:hypothetical protein